MGLSLWRGLWQYLSTWLLHTPFLCPCSPTSGNFCLQTFLSVRSDPCPTWLIRALFVSAKNGNGLACPLIGDRLSESGVCAVEHYAAVREE